MGIELLQSRCDACPEPEAWPYKTIPVVCFERPIERAYKHFKVCKDCLEKGMELLNALVGKA